MSKIETYVNFQDYPLFNPMFNPNQMLEHGIHEGVAINPKHGINFDIGVLDEMKSKGFLQGLTQDQYWAHEPSASLNAYKVLEIIPPFTQKPVIDSLTWFKWYVKLYYGARNTQMDKMMIDWWMKVVVWGWTEAPKNHHTDQMLLQYSHNPGWEPKIILNYLNNK